MISFIRVILLAMVMLATNVQAIVYYAKKGDTLSDLAAKNVPGKIWGRHGSLEQLLKLNPHIRNPNFIRINQIIHLPDIEVVEEDTFTEQSVTKVIENQAAKIIEEQTRKVSSNDKDYTLTLSPFLGSLALNIQDKSTNIESTLASNIYTGVSFKYDQLWSEKLSLFVLTNLSYISFEPSTDDSKELSESNKTLWGLSLGAAYHLEHFHFLGHLSNKKELFARQVNFGEITVDSVAITSLGGRVDYDAFKKATFILGLGGHLDMNLSASTDGYNIKNGNKYGASVYISREKFKTEIDYSIRSQNTNHADQKEQQLLLWLHLNI